MLNRIKLIKTLPHLHPIYLNNGDILISSEYLSLYTYEYILSSQLILKSNIKFREILNILNTFKFNRVEKVTELGEYSLKGDILIFFALGYTNPLRLEFFGNDLENIYLIDSLSYRNIKELNYIVLGENIKEDKNAIKLIDNTSLNDKDTIESDNILKKVIFTNSLRLINNLPINSQDSLNSLDKSKDINNPFEILNDDYEFPQLFYSRIDLLKKEITRLENIGFNIFIQSNNSELSNELDKKYFNLEYIASNFSEFKILNNIKLAAGLISNSKRIAIFTDRELFGTIFLSRVEKTKSYTSNIQRLLKQFEGNIEIGNYVVHEDYGVGIYNGLTQEKIHDEMMEYLHIKYDKNDELFVPINQIEKITKYLGNDIPKITRLGKKSWENIKEKIKKSTRLLARELIEHYAKRSLSKARSIKSGDSKSYIEFVKEFKFKETNDQLRAINEIINDLEKEIPMDRLLVGDVGFGKTEVFMRASFKIVENGGQVAILSPTTVLTSQHYDVFRKRFKNYPINIAFVSRFNTPLENSKIIKDVNEGKIDILIGTHRILSDDIKFKNLQLLVVDEEQRFGVKQKEKIKKINYGIHVLSVSATPIPRTLGMSLSSIQDLSVIVEAPLNRKAITTEIIKDNWQKVSDAITFEIKRGGQIYFLHNEISTQKIIEERLKTLIPGIRIAVIHGRMNVDQIDRLMHEFYSGNFDCLLSTTIIENGLDLPNVNTIIINNAHKFGLSQLYQLRGRVGRSDRNAFCYLMYKGKDLNEYINQTTIYNGEYKDSNVTANNLVKKETTKTYLERLKALVDNQDLGSGFKISSRDLEIRGAGSILGEQQSGHISTIGYALYVEILANEIERLKSLATVQ